jgi:hypothetical protein
MHWQSGRQHRAVKAKAPEYIRRTKRGDCQAAYEALRSRGAAFLTPPHDWGAEIRCFLRDLDGHLVEISQSKSA